jgi:UrcA family protein
MLKSLSCLALSALATAASAQAPLTVAAAPSARVSYAELNLASAAGRATLDARVRSAARRLCLPHGTSDLVREAAGRACLVEAIASARPQVARALAESASGSRLAAADRTLTIGLRR